MRLIRYLTKDSLQNMMPRVSGNISRWIKNWLKDRRQQVNINGKTFNWADVLSGVPQGPVFEPLLFSIYIDDIDDGMSKIWKFADDTKIYKKH